MANNTPGYCLYRDSQGFDISRLPDPYRKWDKTSSDAKVLSINRTGSGKATLHRYTVEALLEYVKDAGSAIGLVRIADAAYATQWTMPDGNSILAYATGNGVLNASVYNPNTGKMTPLPSLGTPTTEFNDASILMAYMMIQADLNDSAAVSGNTITHALLNDIKDAYKATGEIPEDAARLVCDDLYFVLSYGKIPVNIMAGNVTPLTDRRIANQEFATGEVICGNPTILVPSSGAQTGGTAGGIKTVAAAKAIAEPYTSTLHWTPEEELMIPVFPDDTEVPPEVMTIMSRFLASRDWASPMNNPCWRGITAFGKSTGVKILACILHTPLVWMTCATTTETEDFLSKHVPNTDPTPTVRSDCEMPSFDDIANDPAYAYQLVTGVEKEDATCDEAMAAVLDAYARAKSVENGEGSAVRLESKNPFKIVESDFVKALVNGYIVEVQEFSRIRDSGTLVGLNNFNEPDSVIPLVDGRHVRRHKNALVVWTDNIGYTSCRKVDGSVLRRFSFIIDSNEMPKDRALRRIKKNTGCTDKSLLDRMYDVWTAISKFCKEHDITDEGTCSLTELENWVALTMLDGKEAIVETCQQAVIAKLSSDPDTQREIMDGCVSAAMAKAKLTQ